MFHSGQFRLDLPTIGSPGKRRRRCCGPGGANDIAVDEALNASSGLPAASGNSLTLSGQFLLSDNDAASDQLLPQPQDPAADMLAAFKASTNGEHSVKHEVTMAQVKAKINDSG